MKYDFREYVLTNEQRRYFGLNPIESTWEAFEVKDNLVVFFDGNTIKKTIEYSFGERQNEYLENDTELYTRDRQILLPKTSKGKEKKLNYTSITNTNPTGCSFVLRLKNSHGTNSSTVYAYSYRNNKSIPPIHNDDELYTVEDFKAWLCKYIETCPPDYFEKIDAMRTASHVTVKYYNGDIFRFELDRENYGFGLIIGQVRKMQKDGFFIGKHAMNDTMMVPLIVRLYRLKTKNKHIPADEITSHPLMGSRILGDNNIIWGKYEIVGSKELDIKDIEFPMQTGESIEREKYYRFCWGTGMVVLKRLPEKMEVMDNNQFLNHGISASIQPQYVMKSLDSDEVLTNPRHDITHPDNKEILGKILNEFGLDENIDFDEFNKTNGGMTRQEYVEYSRKYERRK